MNSSKNKIIKESITLINSNSVDKTVEKRLVKDKIFSFSIILFSLISTIPLFLILYKLVALGSKKLNLDFFLETSSDGAGIADGIVGTLILITLASLIAVPIGILTGVYLAENKKSKLASIVRFVTDLLQGIPSIVLGIIGYFWIVKPIMGYYCGLAGAFALAIMMLPSIIRSTEETVSMIPNHLKEAAFALGVPYHKTILRVLLPTGMSGILSGVILGISRIAGETAPLMLTLGADSVSRIVIDPLMPQSMTGIPMLIWRFYNDPNLIDLVWSSSLFLMILILGLNLLAKGVAKKWKVIY